MSNPLRSFRIAARTGSADDPPGKEGLANLTAKLMTEGSTRAHSYKALLDRFFVMASRLESQVDKELTVFHGVVHEDHLDEFARLSTEILQYPAFLAEDLERVRQDQMNHLRVNLRGNNDEEMAKEVLYSKLYAGHPYAHHCVGTIAGLSAITVEDVRAFHARQLSVFDIQSTAPMALPQPAMPQGLRLCLIDKPEARSVAMSFGHPITVRRGHADYPALLVAQAWLGQHRNGGRLFDQIREVRGLNYGDYAYIEYFPRGMFQFEPDPNLARQQQIFQVWLRPVDWPKAVFAFRLALHEIDRLREQGISAADFERTRGFLGKYSKLLQKTGSIRQGYAIDSQFYGIPEYCAYLDEALAGLRKEDVDAAVRRHLQTRDLCFVAVGPRMEAFGELMENNSAAAPEYETGMPPEVLAEDQLVQQRPLLVAAREVIPYEEVFNA